MPSTLLVLPRRSRYDKANDADFCGPARELADETLGEGTYDTCWAWEYRAQRAGYTHVILTGQESLDAFQPGHTLSSWRGFVQHLGPVKTVSTFWPQDCVDFKNYETPEEDEEDDRAGNSKDDAPTSRANYRFWFKRDCAKLFNTPEAVPDAPYLFTDNLTAAKELSSCAGSTIYFDIETRPESNTLTCFSYATDSGAVKTVLVYDYNGSLTSSAHALMTALCRAFQRNKIVIHNALFDLSFLALYHNIPPASSVEDTMLMHHRIFPESEKSLAHAISLWTNNPYHKSEGGTWNPRNWAQQDRLLRYNSKDVVTLRAVHRAIRRHLSASDDAGLRASVDEVNAITPRYMRAGFNGFFVDAGRLQERRAEQLVAKDQLARLVRLMSGYNLEPGSPKQLADYFITRLGYEIVSKTDTGLPCVDEGNLRKYLLKSSNPIIRAVLKFKRAQKVYGELGFQLYVHPRKR